MRYVDILDTRCGRPVPRPSSRGLGRRPTDGSDRSDRRHLVHVTCGSVPSDGGGVLRLEQRGKGAALVVEQERHGVVDDQGPPGSREPGTGLVPPNPAPVDEVGQGRLVVIRVTPGRDWRCPRGIGPSRSSRRSATRVGERTRRSTCPYRACQYAKT